MIARLLPAAGLFLFVGVGVIWRTWLHWRRYGTSGFALFQSGHWAQNLRDGLSVLLVVALGAQAVVAAINPASLDRMQLVPPYPLLMWSGAALMLCGTALMAAAQLDLGASWRIGIEEGARPGLVANGLYRFCRNPIFLAMLTALLGFLLLMPTVLSVIAVAATFFGVRRQVHQEEAYLLRTYGSAYAAYAAQVGRFFPGVGRL